tara:strand:+ start:244 stop:537 length:294 start_codon:yes stop_codon:yes gene_type:complete
MEFYKYSEGGLPTFPSSIFLNLLTETEMCAFFRSDTQIIKDTALLMNNRDWVINVESTRFDDVMAACVSEGIFTSDRVTQFKKGIRPSSEAEYRFGI